MDLEMLEQVFAEIDQDHSGALDADELKALMVRANINVSPEELDEMIQMADENGDGLIDLREFKKLFSNF